jgi:PAS domain S-box-containing protein
LPDGNILGMVRDVTERNTALAALRTAEERMRFALESAQVGIWDSNFTTGVVTWSATLEAQYGLAPGTFGGTFEAFVALVHPADREALREAVGQGMKSGADFSTQFRALRPDGTVRWLTGRGRILLADDGRPLRGVGISIDVTERRALEAQYEQAQKMEAIGRLAGGIAHDFNNLLGVILGYSHLLVRSLAPADPRCQDVAEIQKAGATAAALTRQLLAFSRKEIIEPRLLDLNRVLADMRGMLERLIGEDVRVVFSLRPERAPIRADRGQLEQVVMNLVVNARDAMPDGGLVTIETTSVSLDAAYAKTHLSLEPGAYVALTVTDTGSGMTPDVQAHLFEPFFTTKERGKGTGLGLATVHGIVTQSGGSVQVYSEVGRGSSFRVYLPMADAQPQATVPSPDPQPRTGGLTVLVVEDADGLRELARRLLAELGHTAIVAANADEATRLIETEAVDVLLTDVVMPGMSGPDLASRLLQERPTLRVVYMSGYTEDAIVHRGVLAPGVVFLHKPFTVETLDLKIREAVDS